MIVIEMNPRVSRSSALASKATGFPIAKVAAKLAVGYTLDEIENDITGGATPASFEPTIDYVVTKIPRFAFEKFPGADPMLTTAMKSVGEAMAIGRTFAESLQKALRSLETGLSGLDEIEIEGYAPGGDRNVLRAALATPTPDRLLNVAQAMRLGMGVEEIYDICKIDPLVPRAHRRDRRARSARARARPAGRRRQFPHAEGGRLLRPAAFDARRHRRAARRRCCATGSTCIPSSSASTPALRNSRRRRLICIRPTRRPFAGTPANEAAPSDAKKIVILGGGPNRIGQGIEFDYCCCHACFALADAGFETIMINCNPETVSTDYDTSDRLYFEPLTAEDVLEILTARTIERRTRRRHRAVRRPDAAETRAMRCRPPASRSSARRSNRSTSRRIATASSGCSIKLGLKQPQNGIAYSVEQSRLVAQDLGLPLVVRPSYVLGGRAMAIIRDQATFDDYLLGTLPGLVPSDVKARYPNDKTGQINTVLGKNPLLFDRYLADAIEVDVDCLCDGKDVFVAGIMEHIEEAGIHSGDSACSLPPRSLSAETIAQLEEQTRKMALALEVGGLMNVQYALKDGEIFVLEVNPRASRTVPFVAKVIGQPIAKIASRIMAGESLASFNLAPIDWTSDDGQNFGHVGVKESVFPFARFPGVDTVLGPEMRSTGEVIGLDRNFAIAFAKSQLGGGTKVPRKGTVFVSVRDSDKARILETVTMLSGLGFRIEATGGTARYLAEHGLPVTKVNKVSEGRPHCVDAIKNGSIQLVFNTTEGAQALSDSRSLRRAALLHKVPYYTTLAGAIAAAQGIRAYIAGDLEVRALQDYFAPERAGAA